MSFYVSTATFFLLHCDEWDRVVALPRHKFVTGATLLQLSSTGKLANIPYFVTSPGFFEMIDYITTVSDFTDIDPLNMYQRLKKVEEPREGKSDELFSQKVSSPFRQGDSSHP